MRTRSQRPPRDGGQLGGETSASAETVSENVEAILASLRVALTNRLKHIASVGEGGMGVLDLVLDQALERHTVIKRVHEDLSSDAPTLRMFVREAQITGQLEHPNIVPVHELGLEDGHLPYFTMKLVEGRTLEQVIRELPEGPLEHGVLLDLLDAVIKVCDALSFAHSRGVIHLDIKPSNVMVGEFGQVYLMDWGIAQRLGADLAEPTRAEAREANSGEIARVLIGTPTHMAPEQALGANERLEMRTDVFALGGLLYHLLARVAPFAADNMWASVARAQLAECRPLSELAPSTPRGLTRIVERAMQAAPEDRYPSVLDFKEDLVAFVRGDGVFALREVPAGELVVREGDPASEAYIIESGRLEVFQGEAQKRRVLRVMGPGEVFGEMALLAPGPRTASVVALEDAQLRVVTGEALDREMETLKPWMGAFVRTLATRFREREMQRNEDEA